MGILKSIRKLHSTFEIIMSEYVKCKLSETMNYCFNWYRSGKSDVYIVASNYNESSARVVYAEVSDCLMHLRDSTNAC